MPSVVLHNVLAPAMQIRKIFEICSLMVNELPCTSSDILRSSLDKKLNKTKTCFYSKFSSLNVMSGTFLKIQILKKIKSHEVGLFNI